MTGTIEITNLERDAKGVLLALDAKKAFDSVDHKYIESCLQHFGCAGFVPIFRILYSELSTDIIINGTICRGFKIARGVKQGDALSCILFIMCMEPLIRNIEKNNQIRPIYSSTLGKNLPKVYAYADDVNATIKDTAEGVKAVFKEYERLTIKSGLELNADKTEIMQMGCDIRLKTFNVDYLSKSYNIQPKLKVKINGLMLQNDARAMVMDNVDITVSKMEKHFKSWSRRNLSTLGKILIVKSFGISQIIFMLQSMKLEPVDFKKLNMSLYKFIWNRHYLAAKAPERVKREIVNTPIKLGGFGMLDIIELDESLKIRMLGRILDTSHPYMTLIKEGLDLRSYFIPKDTIGLDKILGMGLELLKRDRQQLWEKDSLMGHRKLLQAIGDSNLKDVVNDRGRNSIPFYLMWRANVRAVKDLTRARLNEIRRFIDPVKIPKIENCLATRSRDGEVDFLESYFIKDIVKPLSKLTSREVRVARSKSEVIKEFRIGLTLDEGEALSWALKVSKVNSTKHKNILLRVAHGDIYTKEKLNRFGMIDSPECPRCGEIENLEHKFINCTYVKRIWDIALNSSRGNLVIDPCSLPRTKAIMGSYLNSEVVVLTLNAEILLRLLALKDDDNYLIHPKHFVRNAVSYLTKREKKREVKEGLKSILDSIPG